MKSANASLHLISVKRQLFPKADLDAALEECSAAGLSFEEALRARGVSAETLEQLIRIRARHAQPCGSCGKMTYLLPGEERETKPCEHCGGGLDGRTPAGNRSPESPPPAAGTKALAKAAPRDAAPLERALRQATQFGKLAPDAELHGFEPPRFTPPVERRPPTFAPPPLPAPARPVSSGGGGFQMPRWMISFLALAVIWGSDSLFDRYSTSDTVVFDSGEKAWNPSPDVSVHAKLDPEPPRAGHAELLCVVLARDEVLHGEASYRLAFGTAPFGGWHTLDPAASTFEERHVAGYTADVTLVEGKARLELKVAPQADADPQTFAWDFTVLDASGKRRQPMPWWVRWGFIGLVLFYVLAPVIVKFTSQQAARAELVPVGSEGLPTEVASFLNQRANTLATLGFENVAYLAWNTGRNTFYMVRLVHRANGDSALANALVKPDGAVATQSVGFTTRFVSGGIVETTNSPSYSAIFPHPPTTTIANVREPSLERLYRIHQGLVGEVGRGARKVLPDPGREVEQLARSIVQPVEFAASKGYFSLNARDGRYRATWLGAFLMTWKMLPPLKWIGLYKRHSEEARLRQKYDSI
jgi:hypothetical protein